MKKFNINRKGYDTVEVDSFIDKLLTLTEEKLTEQRIRIDDLKLANRKLVEQINEYKEHESSVGRALQQATAYADEMEDAIKARYALAVERLRNFERRWIGYYKTIANKFPLDDEIKKFANVMANIESELVNVMKTEMNMPEELSSTMIPDIVCEEDSFSLEEALTPKETLEELCKELGLI